MKQERTNKKKTLSKNRSNGIDQGQPSNASSDENHASTQLANTHLEVLNYMADAEKQQMMSEMDDEADVTSAPSSKPATKTKKKTTKKKKTAKDGTTGQAKAKMTNKNTEPLTPSSELTPSGKKKKEKATVDKKTNTSGAVPTELERLRVQTLSYMDSLDLHRQDNNDSSTSIGAPCKEGETKSPQNQAELDANEDATSATTDTAKNRKKKQGKKKKSKQQRVGDSRVKRKEKSTKTREATNKEQLLTKKEESYPSAATSSVQHETHSDPLLPEEEIAVANPPPLTRDGRFVAPGSVAVAGPGASVDSVDLASDTGPVVHDETRGNRHGNNTNDEEEGLPVALPAELVVADAEIPVVPAMVTSQPASTNQQEDLKQRSCLGTSYYTNMGLVVLIILLVSVGLGVGIGVGLSSPERGPDGPISAGPTNPPAMSHIPTWYPSLRPSLPPLAAGSIPSTSPTMFPSPTPSAAPSPMALMVCQTYVQDFYDIGITDNFIGWTPIQMSNFEWVYENLIDLYADNLNMDGHVTAQVTLRSHSKLNGLPGALFVEFSASVYLEKSFSGGFVRVSFEFSILDDNSCQSTNYIG